MQSKNIAQRSRKKAYIFWGVLLLNVLAFLAYRFVLNVKYVDVQVIPPYIFPDGASSVLVKAIPYNSLGFRTPFVTPKVQFEIDEGKEKVEVIYIDDSTAIRLRAKFETGEVVIFVRTSTSILPIRVVIPIVAPLADTDGDGFPDAVELTSAEDRTNFRRWFMNIAESQYYRMDDAWRAEDKDCAGLIRFAFREALKKHDNEWLKKRNFLVDSNIPDIKKYHYPDVPIIGTNIFRTKGGPFQQSDLNPGDSVLTNYVEAARLKDHNLFF